LRLRETDTQPGGAAPLLSVRLAVRCGAGASPPGSPGAASSRASVWDGPAGAWSALAWVLAYRKLAVCFDRRAASELAFLGVVKLR
jgi:hypothetical protein